MSGSVRSRSFLASTGERTGVEPLVTTCFGPRTGPPGVQRSSTVTRDAGTPPALATGGRTDKPSVGHDGGNHPGEPGVVLQPGDVGLEPIDRPPGRRAPWCLRADEGVAARDAREDPAGLIRLTGEMGGIVLDRARLVADAPWQTHRPLSGPVTVVCVRLRRRGAVPEVPDRSGGPRAQPPCGPLRALAAAASAHSSETGFEPIPAVVAHSSGRGGFS